MNILLIKKKIKNRHKRVRRNTGWGLKTCMDTVETFFMNKNKIFFNLVTLLFICLFSFSSSSFVYFYKKYSEIRVLILKVSYIPKRRHLSSLELSRRVERNLVIYRDREREIEPDRDLGRFVANPPATIRFNFI